MARSPSPREEAARRRPRSDEPWLEEAEPETHTLVGRRTATLLLAALVLLVLAVAAGVFLVAEKADSPIDIPAEGQVPLLRSPGPWKVPAEGPGTEGVPVEGQGQIVFGAGEGMDPDLPIDPARLPEEPVPPAPAEAGPTGPPPTDLLPADPPAPRPAPAPAPTMPPEPAAGETRPAQPVSGIPQPVPGTVQLGAFSTEARARAVWKEMQGRFAYLGDFQPSILPVEREGKTLYRLRATGPDATTACTRLKVAGEACEPVR